MLTLRKTKSESFDSSGSILSVSALTNAVKSTLENRFGNISVQGEISNYKLHSSGHRYFTLKDSAAQIACTMWKSKRLSFEPAEGMLVTITGTVTVYPQRGNYQLDVNVMEPAGTGALYMAYEALKAKLDALGWFDLQRKRQIPVMPKAIGISTSPTGAAIQDMLSTLNRRYPLSKIYFRPTLVQGESAAADIAKAIAELNNSDAEVIIIGRGGGSIEDLWCFNTEIVAKAIVESKIPIISAVGHETDFTISDFTADLRAATPTAAAELASKITVNDLLMEIESQNDYINDIINRSLNDKISDLDFLMTTNAASVIKNKISNANQFIDNAEMSAAKDIKHVIKSISNSLHSFENSLNILHPLRPLKKGFAAVKLNGKMIGANDSLHESDTVEIVRLNETSQALIKSVIHK